MKIASQTARTNTEFAYSTCGLVIQSAVEIPGLLFAAGTSASPPYRVHFRPVRRVVEVPPSDETGFSVRHDARGCSIRFADGTVAEVDRRERVINVEGIDGATLADTASYVTGPVVGILAQLEGRACFHGAVVVIDDVAHVLCGPSESGKSTTAALFAREGFNVMSDDVCAVDDVAGSLRVFPSSPRIQLWPEGATMVFGPDHGLPPVSPPWPKLYLDLTDPPRFVDAPARLGGVWILAADIDSVQTLTGSSCLTNLVANAYLPQHGTADIRVRLFDVAARACRTTPVRLLPLKLDPGSRVEAIVRAHRGTKPVA